ERLAQLAERAPIAQRPLEMQLELVHPPHRSEHRDVVQTPLPVIELTPTPGPAPAVLGHEPLKLPVEPVSPRHRPLDVLLPENLPPLLKPQLEQPLIHDDLRLHI